MTGTKSEKIVDTTYLGSPQWHLCVSDLDLSVLGGGYNINQLLLRL
jgi:hypothetical protein